MHVLVALTSCAAALAFGGPQRPALLRRGAPPLRGAYAGAVEGRVAAAAAEYMAATCDALAFRCSRRAARLADGGQLWVAISGGPGAGKSTIAAAVAERCLSLYGVEAVVVPMDGFHYSKAQLAALDPPTAASYLPRRGAPHTFDAELFAAELARARLSKTHAFPTYSRELSDPVPGGAKLEQKHRIVLVEGNYLLLGGLADDADASVAKEAKRWAAVQAMFDDTWFVQPAGGVAEQRRRLVERHLETWTPEKTAAWSASSAREGAEKRSDFNDVPNAHLIARTAPAARLQVVSI